MAAATDPFASFGCTESKPDTLQLHRIEVLLTDLHWFLVGIHQQWIPNWIPQEHAGFGGEPSRVAPGLCPPSQGLEKPSKSKLRRQRASEVRRHLYLSSQSTAPAAKSGSCFAPPALAPRANYELCGGKLEDNVREGKKPVTDEASPCTSSGILPGSLDLVPQTGCTDALGLAGFIQSPQVQTIKVETMECTIQVPVPQDQTFENEREVQEAAAIRIQRWFRSQLTTGGTSISSCDDADMVRCASCGGQFWQSDDEADCCDTCGSPVHSSCTHVFHHPIEPYRVCAGCADARKNDGEESVDEDAAGDVEQSESEEDHDAIGATVDSRLDYMVKYLELDIKGVVQSQVREAILTKIKKTVKWKASRRTSQALKDKITDLDKFMESQLRKQHDK